MAESLKIDRTEVDKLADTLVHAAQVAPGEARKVVQKGALKIKTAARASISDSKHFPRLAGAITYETTESDTTITAEIGPERGRPQANLAHIPEYGNSKTPARPYMLPAGEAEAPRFEAAMQALKVPGLE